MAFGGVTVWCPSCGAEYRAGLAECRDCRVTLVSNRPESLEAVPLGDTAEAERGTGKLVPADEADERSTRSRSVSPPMPRTPEPDLDSSLLVDQPMVGRFCPECGSRHEDSAKFCKECGHRVAGSPRRASAPSLESATPYRRTPSVAPQNVGVLIPVALVVLIAIVVTVVVATRDGSGDAAKRTLTGTFGVALYTADLSTTFNAGDPCAGSSGFPGITEGTNVTVLDPKGTMVATGSLGAGSYLAGTDNDLGHNFCEFPFSVANIPKESIYSVSIGSNHGQNT